MWSRNSRAEPAAPAAQRDRLGDQLLDGRPKHIGELLDRVIADDRDDPQRHDAFLTRVTADSTVTQATRWRLSGTLTRLAPRRRRRAPDAAVVSERPLVPIDRSLTHPKITVQPVFDDSEVPRRWHSCERMYRDGRTKDAPSPRPGVSTAEIIWRWCPCGSHCVLHNGRKTTDWCDRNAARRDPKWPTRRSFHQRNASPYVHLI
jgi:hypothetical protein